MSGVRVVNKSELNGDAKTDRISVDQAKNFLGTQNLVRIIHGKYWNIGGQVI